MKFLNNLLLNNNNLEKLPQNIENFSILKNLEIKNNKITYVSKRVVMKISTGNFKNNPLSLATLLNIKDCDKLQSISIDPELKKSLNEIYETKTWAIDIAHKFADTHPTKSIEEFNNLLEKLTDDEILDIDLGRLSLVEVVEAHDLNNHKNKSSSENVTKTTYPNLEKMTHTTNTAQPRRKKERSVTKRSSKQRKIK